MRLAPTLLAAAVLTLAAVVALPAASAAWGAPEPLTERGQIIQDIYAKIALVGVIVFVFVFALLVWILVRYRETTGHGRSTHEAHRGSIKAEMTWTLIPLAIMLWIGVMSYAGLVKLDEQIPLEDAEMAVTITGYQWAWEMDYGAGVVVSVSASPDPEGHLAFSDTFHLPADTNILLNITGGDVIHAFNILDANRAYVSMDDANPFGPHKVHQQVLSFPAGRYSIQCKEMCLNPGHAYMRAEMIVEPKEDFEAWLADRQLAAGHDLVTRVAIDATNTALTTQDNLTIVAGTRVIVDFSNAGTQPVSLSMGNGFFVNETVPAGESRLFAFDTGLAGGYTLTASNGGRLLFDAIEATPVEVDLGAYRIIPQHLDLEAGTTYLFQLKNVHSTIHNLYIGDLGSGDIARSVNLAPGAGGSFTWTAVAGEYDMWCAVAGHVDNGMVGTVSVS